MSNEKHVCFDRILPLDLARAPSSNFGFGEGPARAAALFNKLWPNGSTLHCRFIGGTVEQHATVQRFARLWSEHANIMFEFGSQVDAEIRIAFEDDGAWSYIGTDSLGIPRNEATMNFGWLDEAVVLHEFGHALGLIHEHQNPNGGIQWNRENVIASLSGSPNFWDLDTIEHNMFKKYGSDQIRGTTFDDKSIMLYSFPQSWTSDGFHSEPNDTLSITDQSFIGGIEAYPKQKKPIVALTVFDARPHQADIGSPGEEDLYEFTATDSARYTIETAGQTDVAMTLYGPDSQTRMIDQDDDGGINYNSKIEADLLPGKYFVQIRHYNAQQGTGSYGITVRK